MNRFFLVSLCFLALLAVDAVQMHPHSRGDVDHAIDYSREADPNTGFVESKPSRHVLYCGQYRVRPGDTRWSIYNKYGIPESQLMQANPSITWNALQVDQMIALPSHTEALYGQPCDTSLIRSGASQNAVSGLVVALVATGVAMAL